MFLGQYLSIDPYTKLRVEYMGNKTNWAIVNIICFCYVFRDIIVRHGLENVPYIFTVALIVINLLRLAVTPIRRKYLILFIFIYFGTLRFLFSVPKMGITPAALGFVAFFFNLIMWVLVFNNTPKQELETSFKNFLYFNMFLGCLTAISGIYQYFFDATIFGYVTHSIYGNQQLMQSGGVVRRATGFIGSAQNYALYLGILTTVAFFGVKKKEIRVLLTTMLLLGGLVSGSRAYAVMIIGVVIGMAFATGRRGVTKQGMLKVVLSIVFSLVLLPFFIESTLLDNETFVRLFKLFHAKALSVHVEKLKVLTGLNVLTGIGFGHNERLVAVYSNEAADFVSVESYLIGLYLQGGLILLVYFLYMYIRAVSNSFLNGAVFLGVLLCILLVNLYFTPSFSGLAMSFLIWPIVIYAISLQNDDA